MEISNLVIYGVVIALLMLCSAFFSGTETALSALTRTQVQRLRRKDKKGSSAVIRFLDEPRRLFITVLFGNTLVNMAFISLMGALIYQDIFQGGHPGAAYVVAIVVETTVLLLLGEITPKSFAIRNAESLSLRAAPALWAFSRLIFPFRRVLRFFTDSLLPLFGVHGDVHTLPVTSEEIRATFQATTQGGALDASEGEILSNIFEMQETKVKEIMVPRTKVVSVEVSTPIHAAFQIAMQKGYSRLPVYRKRLDNICGIFYVKDLPRWTQVNVSQLGRQKLVDLTLDEFLSQQGMLGILNPGQENTLVRPPFFVFKTRNIGSVLKEMTQKKKQMCILLDEFGGVEGLATAEDIVEEVVGEIADEYDVVPSEKIMAEPGRPNSYLVPGAMSLRSVNRKLKLKLDISRADTVSGYVTGLAGTIPKAGDVLRDSFRPVEFEVLKMEENRIKTIRIRIKRPNPAAPPALVFSLLPLLFFLGMAWPTAISEVPEIAPGFFTLLVFGIVLVLSLVLMGFFNGSETAVVSASTARIEVLAQQADRRARVIKRLMQEPDRMLGTVLVGTNLMATSAGVASLRLAQYVLPGRPGLQKLLNTLVMTVVILLFCEILPKTIFRAKSDVLALRSAPMLRFFDIAFRPVVVLFSKVSNWVASFAGKEDRQESIRIMREELKLLAEMGEEEGALKKEQIRMVHGILDLEDRTIGQIMTPLVEMIALPDFTETTVFLERVAETAFSRIPIYRERIDNIIGVVNVLDVLYSESPPASIQAFVRKDIRHEPESRKVFPLLRELTRSRNSMVFVVDEYGGVVGLVTTEDLVEEVVGDILDEKDMAESGDIQQISDRVMDCDGKTEVQLLIHDYDLSIPEGEYNTVAGFMIESLQRIPKKGESLTWGKLRFLVLDADAKSVRRIRILKK